MRGDGSLRVIGLDLSLCHTALVEIRSQGGTESVAEKFIQTRAGEFVDDVERIRWIRDEVVAYCRSLPGQVLVCVEAPALHARGRSLWQIFALNAVVRTGLRDAGIEFVDITPSEVKKFVTGRGNADKQLILREIWRRFQYEAADDNAADAYALARIGMLLRGSQEARLTQFQKEVADNVRRRWNRVPAAGNRAA